MRTCVHFLLAVLTLSLGSAGAQEKSEPGNTNVYKVDFVIRDGSDAAARSGRRYSLLIDASGKGLFRVGQRVPYATGSFQPGLAGAGVSPLVSTQYSYADVGVNIECRLREMGGKIELHVSLDMSTLVQPDRAPPTPPNPTIGTARIEMDAMVAAGKTSQIASIDDPVTMRKLDVEATVTKLN